MNSRTHEPATQTRSNQSAQPAARRLTGPVTENVVSLRYDLPGHLTSRPAHLILAQADAVVVSRAISTEPARAAHLLWLLQRQYGNGYVRRVVELARSGNGDLQASPPVEAAIEHARGGGQPLDDGVRTAMEPAFGADFSRVRVHTGTAADALNRAVNARAFTTRNDIFFRAGEYAPGSSKGRELLAHELTHVVQQTGEVHPKLAVSEPDDRAEQEADRVARQIVADEQTDLQSSEQVAPEQTGTLEAELQDLAVENTIIHSKSQIASIQRLDTVTKPTQGQFPIGQARRGKRKNKATKAPRRTIVTPPFYIWIPDEAKYQSDWNRALNYTQTYIDNAQSTTTAMIIAYLAAEKQVTRIMALKDPESIWKTIALIALSVAVRAIPAAGVIADRLKRIGEGGDMYFAKGLEEGIKAIGSYLVERKIPWNPPAPRVEPSGDVLGLLMRANGIVQDEIKVKAAIFNGWQLAWDRSKQDRTLPPLDYNLYDKVAGRFEPNISVNAEAFQPQFEKMMAEQAISETVEAGLAYRITDFKPVYSFYTPTLSRASLRVLMNRYGFTLSHIQQLSQKGFNPPYAPWNRYEIEEGESP